MKIRPGDQVYFEFSKLKRKNQHLKLRYADGYYTYVREIGCQWTKETGADGSCMNICHSGLIFDPPLEPDGCITWGGKVPYIRNIKQISLPDELFEIDI